MAPLFDRVLCFFKGLLISFRKNATTDESGFGKRVAPAPTTAFGGPPA
jgi:hypothetical protein